MPRLNPESEWIVQRAPALRIVTNKAWVAAHARLGALKRGSTTRRPKRPLSGLLKCVCSGSMTIQSANYYGSATAKDTGQRDRSRKARVDQIEARVLEGLRDKMLHPDLVAEYAREYYAELARLRQTAGRRRVTLTSERARLDREIDRVYNALVSSTDDTRKYTARIKAAERRQDEIDVELKRLGEEPRVIDFHPKLVDAYRGQIDQLAEILAADPSALPEVADALRTLIDHIIVDVESDDPRGFGLTIVGDLAGILEARTNPDWNSAKRLVAGEGFEPPTKGL